MATKKTGLPDRGSVDQAVAAATAVATKAATDKSKAQSKAIPVRVNEIDYNRLRGLFGAQGLALARAGNLALFYVAEQLEAGRISMTKAGIIDRRG
ncbi:MAG: hypothetical protein FWD94_02865 [Treponema sp.]|nr:hypothetical protein [Treponema sp.]